MPLTSVSGETICSGDLRPYLVFETKDGAIVAELFEAAAPRSVRRLVALVVGEETGIGADPSGDRAQQIGYYDGLTFNYTKPHVEIITAEKEAPEKILIEKELDAQALGLHERRVESAGEAMDIFQLELFPAYNKVKKSGRAMPQMKQWLEQWESSGSADFLVGVSRQEINEAIGYVYQSGLESRPVEKGSLALRPASSTHSTPRLSIALRDLPERTGRHVVIGKITEGLELADDISIRPLDVEPGFRSYDNAPRNPVVIESVRLKCIEKMLEAGNGREQGTGNVN